MQLPYGHDDDDSTIPVTQEFILVISRSRVVLLGLKEFLYWSFANDHVSFIPEYYLAKARQGKLKEQSMDHPEIQATFSTRNISR